MRTLVWALATLMTATLGIFSGLIKVKAFAPVYIDEEALLRGIGFQEWMVMGLGGLQIALAIGVLLPSVRRSSALLLNLTWVAFATALAISGFEMFALGAAGIMAVGMIPMLFHEPPTKRAPAPKRERASRDFSAAVSSPALQL